MGGTGMHILKVRLDRRFMLTGILALLAAPVSAQLGLPLSSDRLEKLLEEAMKGGEGKFAQPEIIGLAKGSTVKYRGVAREAPNTTYNLSMVVPEIEDGLLFYRGTEKPKFFVMHRTGRHLRRILSARNTDGVLSNWTGPAADKDFVAQLHFWANAS
jgi:hypothetical protein